MFCKFHSRWRGTAPAKRQSRGTVVKVKRILKWTIVTALALALVAVIGLFTADLGFLRPTIEKRLGLMTGRDVSFGSRLSIKLGRELVIQAGDLRLSNATWAGSGDLAHIANASLVIDTRSLLSGPVVLKQLTAEGVTLLLMQNEAGQSNWELGESETVPAPDGELPFLVETVTLRNASIEFRSPRLDQPLVAEVAELQESVNAEGMIETRLTGRLNGKAVEFNGTAGPYERLVSGDDFELAGAGRFGDIQLSGKAVFDNLYRPQRPLIEASMEGPDLEELTSMLGIAGLGHGPVSLSATSSADGGVLDARLKGFLGGFKVDINSQTNSLQSFGDVLVDARISGPNFGRIARLAALEGWPEKPFDVNVTLQRKETLLEIRNLNMSLAGAQFELQGLLPAFPDLAGADLKIKASGSDLAPFRDGLGFTELPAGAFSITGDIASPSDAITRVDMDFNTPLAKGAITGAIGGGADLLGTDLEIKARGDDASLVGKMLELPGLQRAPWTLSLGLRVDNAAYYDISSLLFEAQGFRFDLHGQVGSVDVASNTRVDFSVSGARLSDFQAVAGEAAALPAEPFSLAGGVESVKAGWKLSEVRGNAGATGFSFSGILGSGDQLEGTDLAVLANGSGLDGFLGPDTAVRLPNGPFELRTGLAISGGQLQLSKLDFGAGPLKIKGDVQLPWPLAMTDARFSLDIAGQDISRVLPDLGGLRLDPQAYSAQLKGMLQSGRFNIEQGRLQVGESRLSLEGSFTPPPELSSTSLRLSFESPDLSKLGTFNDVRWQSVAFSLSSAFTGTGKRVDMNQFRAQLGDSRIDGSFGLDFGPAIPVFTVQLSTAQLDLRPFLPEATEQPDKSKEELKTARLIPELDLPLESLAGIEGNFSLNIGRIILRNGYLSDALLNGMVRNGSLAISELGAGGHKGRVSMTLDLVPLAEGKGRLAASIKSDGFVPRSGLLTATEQDLSPAFDTDIRLQGDGQTLRGVAGSLSGNITIQSEGGQLRNRKQTDRKRAILAEIVSAISPEAAGKDVVNISCLAVVIKASEGKLRLDPGVAVQSDKLNIFAKGNVDLASEKLDINFSTQTRKSVDVSASELFSPYVKLSGTLADPSLALDPKGTLLSGGAAYLSGGLSLLAKKALDTINSNNPCQDHLREAVKNP